MVQYRIAEHIAVESAEALTRGLRREKTTFRQRYLYCRFDMAALSEDCLCELESLAIEYVKHRGLSDAEICAAAHLTAIALPAWIQALPAERRSAPTYRTIPQ